MGGIAAVLQSGSEVRGYGDISREHGRNGVFSTTVQVCIYAPASLHVFGWQSEEQDQINTGEKDDKLFVMTLV